MSEATERKSGDVGHDMTSLPSTAEEATTVQCRADRVKSLMMSWASMEEGMVKPTGETARVGSGSIKYHLLRFQVPFHRSCRVLSQA